MSEDEAITEYKKTGKHLGEFSTPEEASKYAIDLERRQNSFYETTYEGRRLLEQSLK